MKPHLVLRHLVFPLLFLISCKQEKARNHFGLLVYNTKEDILYEEAPSLAQGSIDVATGSRTQNELFFTQKNNGYYGVDQDNGDFVKYTLQEGRLVKEKQIPFEKVTGWTPVASWYSWISDGEILLGSSKRGKGFMYAVIDVKTMRIVKYGPLDIPLPPEGINYGGVMGRLVDNNLYIAYMLYRYEDRKAPAGDTIYLASINYPTMNTRNITKDIRSTFPGGYNLFWEVSTVYNGYLYFIAEPGSRLRYHPHLKPAVMRIKIGEDQIDPDYFFLLEDQPQHEFYGLFTIGNGQALTKVVDIRKINEFSDFFMTNAAEYYQLDLINKTKTKLAFPFDRLDFHPNVFADGDNLYVAISDSTANSDIWNYNLRSHKYEKGLHVNGQVLFLNKLP